ncbi:MAG: HAD family hydrolase [Kiloniellales bacterium]|nr:HAD family hydrolase [Kiloniellales bacterium]
MTAAPGRIRGVLFDKDGVLIDFEATWDPVNRRLAAAMAGGDLALEARLLAAGGYDGETGSLRPGTILAAGTSLEVAAAWIDHLPAWEEAALAAEVDRFFDSTSPELTVPLLDVAALFQRLKGRGLALGVATNDSALGARRGLERLGGLAALDFLAGYDSGHGAKPAPGMAEAFCRATGLAAAEVAVVGDNLHDLEMGRAAGAGLLIGVRSGTGDPAALAAAADHVIDGAAELEALLDGL